MPYGRLMNVGRTNWMENTWDAHDILDLWSHMLPVNIYLFKVNNRNTRKRCEICSKLTIKTSDVGSGAFNVNFLMLTLLFQVFLLLTLNK